MNAKHIKISGKSPPLVFFLQTSISFGGGRVSHRLDAVSYTHLDVYKRQVFCYSSFSTVLGLVRKSST